MTARTPEQIAREITEVMTRSFPDKDLPENVGPTTRAFADLGLASIELVVLGERLEQFYGKRLPYGPFLASLRNRGADDLELGDLITFLQQNT